MQSNSFPKDALIQLSHGGGGQEMEQLIKQVFFNTFQNPILEKAEDAATLDLTGPIAMTTDSFVVSPLFFKGGNIGNLAVAGSCNDLAMIGAKPQYLTCGFILEEGMPVSELLEIVQTMASEMKTIGVELVCGDTKVVPKGKADKVFINTTAMGSIIKSGVSAHALKAGDQIIVSRDIGCHGASILADREALRLSHQIESDCELLWPCVEQLLKQDIDLHAMRDATRGGIAGVLNEWCRASKVSLNLQEDAIPVSEAVQGVCELFGFEPYDLANEGTFVLAVAKEDTVKALEICRHFHESAQIIGEVVESDRYKVVLNSAWGSQRYLEMPQGELLPRIC